MTDNRTKVAVIIKTLNEEKNIRRAIESSIKALSHYDGEVIVADSASTDQTVQTAMHFPVTVVQIALPNERCCGVGPQLGYQHSISEYIYILDGDMELDPEFLKRAVNFLDQEPRVAGVAGYIREVQIANLEFQARVKRQKKWQPQNVAADAQCLVGGALYRRAAIEEVGYLSDRNLHAFEEYDLGARLRKKGWRLVRLPDHAADHYGYTMNTARLLLYRASTGNFHAIGELLRAAINGGYVKTLCSELRAIHLAIGVWLYWIIVLMSVYFVAAKIRLLIFLAMTILPLALMTARTKSIKLAVYSILLWHASAVGLLFGVLRNRKPPRERIQSQILQPAEARSIAL